MITVRVTLALHQGSRTMEAVVDTRHSTAATTRAIQERLLTITTTRAVATMGAAMAVAMTGGAIKGVSHTTMTTEGLKWRQAKAMTVRCGVLATVREVEAAVNRLTEMNITINTRLRTTVIAETMSNMDRLSQCHQIVILGL